MYEKFNEAVLFAANAHAHQLRKITETPYIYHPMEVSSIISRISHNEDLMIAGLLHDTVEDCGVSLDTIEEKFGPRVAELVRSETEDKQPECPAAETWIERKELSLEWLRDTCDIDIKTLWLADKVSNMRSFCFEYKKSGENLWQLLNQKDPAKQEWYYRTIADYTAELKDTEVHKEYCRLLDELFGPGENGSSPAEK